MAWDDPAADPAAFDLVVVRSTWNYFALPEFLAWMKRAAVTRLANPADVMAWNCDKAYLFELAAAGVCPHRQRPRGTWRPRPPALEDLVVSRARRGVLRREALLWGCGRAFLRETCSARDMLVQPYVGSVDGHGEPSLVVAAVTHAVAQEPAPGRRGRIVGPSLTPTSAPSPTRSSPAARLLYARDVAAPPTLADADGLDSSNLRSSETVPALARFVRAIADYGEAASGERDSLRRVYHRTAGFPIPTRWGRRKRGNRCLKVPLH